MRDPINGEERKEGVWLCPINPSEGDSFFFFSFVFWRVI